ncbi:MAG: tetratricopeptide repeat protein [Bacteriovoracia bacterium]
MERLFSFRLLLSIFFSLGLLGCATTHPQGKVVRLQSELGQKEATVLQLSPEDSPLGRQKDSGALAVPTNPEDAAVFYFSMGQAYSLDNDPQRSIEAYRATLVHDPKSALVRARLAAELVKLGSFAEAKTLCEEALKLDPKYVDSYLLLAGIQVAAKEYEAALATYRQALKIDPQNRDALLYFGVTLAEVGKVKEGVVALEKLVKLKDSAESNIDRAVAYYYLAKVYDQAGQRSHAIQAFESALKHRPAFSKAAIALADIYVEMKNPAKAKASLEEAFAEGRSADLAERLADIYLGSSDFKGAVVFLETLVEEDPANENVKLRLALVYWQLKWTGKARLLLSDLHDRFPASNEITYYLGELAFETGDISSALNYYSQISPDYAKYDQMVFRVVALQRANKQYDQAVDFMQNAIKKRPDLVAFYPALAAVYEDQLKLTEARFALERGERLFPNDEAILYYLGFLYDRLGDKDKGVATMERLLGQNPNNPNALNFVGYTLLEQNKDLNRAEDYLSRAVALKPGDAFVLDSYGWLLYRQGKSQAAMKQLEKAFALRMDEGVIGEHLADVYTALNMPKKALAVYQQALKAGGEKEFVARVEQKLKNLVQAIAVNTLEQKRPARGAASLRKPASR